MHGAPLVILLTSWAAVMWLVLLTVGAILAALPEPVRADL